MTTRNILSGGGDGPAPPESDPETSGAGAFEPVDSGGSGANGRIRAKVDPERDLACCRLPLTDLGNAERWRVRFGADFRFCGELGWFHWDERRWKLLSEEKESLPPAVMQSVFTTVRAIRNEAALVAASGYEPPVGLTEKEMTRVEAWADAHGTSSYELYTRDDEDGRLRAWIDGLEPMDMILGKSDLWSQKIAAWAKTSEGAGKLASIAKLAKSFPEIAIEPGELDTDPMAINVMNGTLRLERMREKRSADEIASGKSVWRMGGWRIRRHPHRREDLITKLAPVKFSAGAKCPEYDAFIATVQPDAHMRRFLHQWGGYSLTGDITEHKMAFFYGQGRNGKGTWVEAVAFMAGDYAGAIGIESLLDSGGQRRGDQATPDLAELPGVRFLRVSEPQKGMRFNDGLIKQLTGGDPVKARHLNKGFFEFFPDFKITVSGNTKPIIKDISHGMWARMQLVPWDTVIGEEAIDRDLPAKLKAEAPGVLNRLIEGLLDWKENGLIIPEQVRTATRAYRDASDELGRFLRDICEVSDDHANVRAPSGELHKLYKAWSEVGGGSSWGPKGFKSAMEDKGFKAIPSNGIKWLGVQIRPGVTIEGVERGEWPGRDEVRDEVQNAPAPPDDGWADNVPPGWD